MQEPEAVVSGHPMLIAGELVESSSGLSDPVVNPATGENFDYVPHGSREDLDRAVDAAAEAFKTWSVTPFEERAKCLLKFAEEVEKIADELAKAQTMEQGKPLANSMGEVRGLIGSCKRYAETGEITDDIVSEDDDAQYKIVYAPRGVVGGIAPWNFPIGTVSGKILPSTITGNTFENGTESILLYDAGADIEDNTWSGYAGTLLYAYYSSETVTLKGATIANHVEVSELGL